VAKGEPHEALRSMGKLETYRNCGNNGHPLTFGLVFTRAPGKRSSCSKEKWRRAGGADLVIPMMAYRVSRQ